MSDFDYFISSDLPIEHIVNVLRVKKMSEGEIDTMIDKINVTREQTLKAVRKFMNKVRTHYGQLDVPELIKKGMKHADKYGLSEAQKKAFINLVLKGDTQGVYSYRHEIKNTKMSKFLGYDAYNGSMIRVEPKDHAKLNELHMLYENTKHIHNDLRTQVHNYRDCAPEAISGKFNPEKHVVSVSIHPVIAALFFPKCDYLERKMLTSNIGRMVLMRGQAYMKKYDANMFSNVSPAEMDAELELATDIATDPNSLAYLSDESPLDNLIKRFRCQIELYKTVLNLRQGKYYSTGYDENDGITGFVKALDSYEATAFDSLQFQNVNDEGTVLRKLLAIFSCRPTLTQLTSLTGFETGINAMNITGVAKSKFVTIPIINVKLPINMYDANARGSISLQKSLTQADFFVEGRSIVPKTKSVIYSNSVAFFYVNRIYPTNDYVSLGMNCYNIPQSLFTTTGLNDTKLVFDCRQRIGRDWFDLKSVVMIQRPTISGVDYIPTGCTAAVCVGETESSGMYSVPQYIHYNPSIASIQFLDPNLPEGTKRYISNTPVSYIDEYASDSSSIGFRDEAQSRGTIFVYKRVPTSTDC